MKKTYPQHKPIPFVKPETAKTARQDLYSWARHKGGTIDVQLKKVG